MLQDWEAQRWIEEDHLACWEHELLNRDAEHDAGARNDEAFERNAESTDESNSESEMDVEVHALLKEHIKLKKLLKCEVDKMKAKLAKISKKPWKVNCVELLFQCPKR
jgi:D-hexose-6-phosphate mutarotase